MPDIRARHKILKVHTKEVPLGKGENFNTSKLLCLKFCFLPDVDLEVVARGTIGFSGEILLEDLTGLPLRRFSTGADIANLINQAAIHSSTQGSQSVTMESLEWAKDKIIMGKSENKSLTSPS